MKALIVGNGLIGSEVSRQWILRGHETVFFTSKHKRNGYAQEARQADVVFLAIPTRDEGQIATDYILETLKLGVPIVTSEKGSLAYHFATLHSCLDKIGYVATVGGGSGMLDFFRFPHYQMKEIRAVINGTLNFLFSGGTVSEAINLGLCEPGAKDLVSVVHAELKDVMLKLTILFNLSEVSGDPLAPLDFTSMSYSEDEIKSMLDSGSYHYVVTITQTDEEKPVFGMLARKGKWIIKGEFVKKDTLPFHPPLKHYNAFYCVDEIGSKTEIFGLGAGPRPTAAAMIADALQLV